MTPPCSSMADRGWAMPSAPALMLRTAPSFTVAAVPVSIRIARMIFSEA
jgi:hypothetical protein